MRSGDSADETRRTAYLSPENRGRDTEAEAAPREAVRLPRNAVDWQRLGDEAYEQEHYAEAEYAYEKAARLDPGNTTYHDGLGRALLAQRRYPEAEAALREAVRLDPGNTIYHNHLGRALLAQRRYPEAEAALREAVRLDPGNPVCHGELGQLLLDQERYEEAEAALREAVRLDPGKATYHDGLGGALLAQGRESEAEAALREAVRLGPDDPTRSLNLSVVLFAQGRESEAEAALREAVRLDSHDPVVRQNVGQVLLHQRRYGEAVAAYEEAARLDPGNPVYYSELGQLLLADERYPDAAAALREATRLDPTSDIYRHRLMRALGYPVEVQDTLRHDADEPTHRAESERDDNEDQAAGAEATRLEAASTGRRTASRMQVVWMTLGASLGAVFGVVAIITAAAVTNSSGVEVWVLFTVCESLALVTGIITLSIQRQRDEFITSAVTFVMRIEDFLGPLGVKGVSTSDPLKLATPEYSEAAGAVLSRALGWRDALLASRDLDIAARFQYSIERLQHAMDQVKMSRQ
jgi:Flp pilus assembly protein TadD